MRLVAGHQLERAFGGLQVVGGHMFAVWIAVLYDHLGRSRPLTTTRPLLLTVDDAAVALSVSPKTIRRLIAEADANRKSRWRWGRELIDLAPIGSSRRMVRVNLAAVAPSTAP